MALPLGNIQFAGIQIDARQVANALRTFVSHGSERFHVAKEQLTIISRVQNQTNPPVDIAAALEMGIRLFDAIYYFSLPLQDRPTVTYVPLNDGDADPTISEIAKAILYCYIYLMVRGRTPNDDDNNANAQVPQFLRSVMSLNDNPTDYVSRVCSFELGHVSPAWVKYIRIGELSAEVQNRIALGMVGYRIPSALTNYRVKAGVEPEVERAVRAVTTFLQRGPVWDCVAITRTPAFQNATTNMNKNCTNLILKAFTDDQIDNLMTTRVLPVRPVDDPKFNQWRTWDDNTFANFTDYVFPAQHD